MCTKTIGPVLTGTKIDACGSHPFIVRVRLVFYHAGGGRREGGVAYLPNSFRSHNGWELLQE